MILPRLSITERQFHLLTSRVVANPHIEICGVLGGVQGVVRGVYIVSNVAVNPARSFLMNPKQLFRIMRYLDKMGLEVLAFFHSHPEGSSDKLSEQDFKQHHYPDSLLVILVPDHGRLTSLRVFQVTNSASQELPIQIFGG